MQGQPRCLSPRSRSGRTQIDPAVELMEEVLWWRVRPKAKSVGIKLPIKDREYLLLRLVSYNPCHSLIHPLGYLATRVEHRSVLGCLTHPGHVRRRRAYTCCIALTARKGHGVGNRRDDNPFIPSWP